MRICNESNLKSVISFKSGISRNIDAEAFDELGFNLGFNCRFSFSNQWIYSLIRQQVYNRKSIFVDSGAFNEFKSGECPDWDKVFAIYDQIQHSCAGLDLSRLSLVMPDKVGDQQESLSRQLKYADKIQSYINSGIRVILPIQIGQATLEENYSSLKNIFSGKFAVGVPSNKAACRPEDFQLFVESTDCSNVHFLGCSDANRNFAKFFRCLKKDAIISCDSNRMTSVTTDDKFKKDQERLIDTYKNNIFNDLAGKPSEYIEDDFVWWLDDLETEDDEVLRPFLASIGVKPANLEAELQKVKNYSDNRAVDIISENPGGWEFLIKTFEVCQNTQLTCSKRLARKEATKNYFLQKDQVNHAISYQPVFSFA
ncbi:MAG: hypothetical protein HRT88_00200 [Lentisphaeraceae bacterium]|nr:hypothetical protein [Lentisphaeraceae bacterium]